MFSFSSKRKKKKWYVCKCLSSFHIDTLYSNDNEIIIGDRVEWFEIKEIDKHDSSAVRTHDPACRIRT